MTFARAAATLALCVFAVGGCMRPPMDEAAERHLEETAAQSLALREADEAQYGEKYARLVEEVEDYYKPGLFSRPPTPGGCSSVRALKKYFANSWGDRYARCTEALVFCYAGDVQTGLRLEFEKGRDAAWRAQTTAFGFEAFPTVLAYAACERMRAKDGDGAKKFLGKLRAEYPDAWLVPPPNAKKPPVRVADFLAKPKRHLKTFAPASAPANGRGMR